MTREELVKQKAQEFASSGEFSPTLTECFIAGAEWEHKRLVEKACDWLRTTSNFYQGGSDNLPEVICMFDTISGMVDSFRKEMADNFQKVMEA